jgi:hypothetical protein
LSNLTAAENLVELKFKKKLLVYLLWSIFIHYGEYLADMKNNYPQGINIYPRGINVVPYGQKGEAKSKFTKNYMSYCIKLCGH